MQLAKDAPFALRVKHESRPHRKTVFDGLRTSLVGGLVNKFPVRQKCTAARFAPFVGPDTKSLTASRKRPLRGLHEKSGCRRSNCDPLISCHFVFRAERRVADKFWSHPFSASQIRKSVNRRTARFYATDRNCLAKCGLISRHLKV